MGADSRHVLLGNGLASYLGRERQELALADGSRVGVIGGGPAGSLFAYFVRRLAETVDLDIVVDIYEPRLFTYGGPAGCNHCGGIVSESLVQLLATEGINLPPTIVQRGIESYVLHTDVGDVRIEAASQEKRIAAVFRGNGPREAQLVEVAGFDRFLLDLASSVGAKVVRKLASAIAWHGGKPQVSTPDGRAGTYDLVAVAAGVNSQTLQMFDGVAPDYVAPRSRRTFICEFDLGEETVRERLGDSMHVFLLEIPRLKFAALIPKGAFVTLCLLGDDVDESLVERFLASPEVARCFPRSVAPRPACHCFPRINIKSAVRPFADRLVWIGDSGASRIYKDGIGAAYRTAKSAAKAAVFNGISARDFEQHYWPECRALIADNAIASVIFGTTTLIQKVRFIRRGVLRMTAEEQEGTDTDRPMSSVLWDVFTGSAPYREILLRTLHPDFLATLAWNLIAGNVSRGKPARAER